MGKVILEFAAAAAAAGLVLGIGIFILTADVSPGKKRLPVIIYAAACAALLYAVYLHRSDIRRYTDTEMTESNRNTINRTIDHAAGAPHTSADDAEGDQK